MAYLHPDAQQLIADVQLEYVDRYGGPDFTPVDDDDFSPPNGRFVVAYEDGVAVAMGGWRLLDPADHPLQIAGVTAELKRMYVVPGARGRGHARAVLSELERTAHDAGADWLILETGTKQPEAISLYEATGYQDIPAFGHYAAEPLSVHLGKRLSPDTAAP